MMQFYSVGIVKRDQLPNPKLRQYVGCVGLAFDPEANTFTPIACDGNSWVDTGPPVPGKAQPPRDTL